MKDCLFCKIAKGELKSATIFENGDFRVIMDRFPSGKGHALILTKEHFDDIYQMDAETAAKLFALASEVSKAVKKATNCDGMNILQNNGEAAGQTVKHFHLHLIPRYENDGFALPWQTKQVSEEELADLAAEIRKWI
ncbi:MAG: HIT family protein [Eubacteriales bacterium]|nr:HIT family protein [Eubacteriales bacterium]